MSHRLIEISRPCRLYIENFQLVVEQEGERVGSAPLEDLAVLILDSYGILHSNQVFQACAERNVAVVVCDAKHTPASLALPIAAHSLHAKVLREQIAASEPVKKRLWQQIVVAKLQAQASLLARRRRSESTKAAAAIRKMAAQVRSGDPENLEAQAAVVYFDALFEDGFLRDRDAPDQNACLNYGYAILRASVARAIVGTGLHPALGVHHRNQYNPFALADDFMEPFRPLVDECVLGLAAEFGVENLWPLDPALKRRLLEFTGFALKSAGKSVPFALAVANFVASCKRMLCDAGRKIQVPIR